MPGTLISVDIDQQALKNLEHLEHFDEVATKHFSNAMNVAVAIGRKTMISEVTQIAGINRSAMMSEIGGSFTPLAPINPQPGQVHMFGTFQILGPMNMTGIVGNSSGKYFKMANAGRGPGKHPPALKLQDWAEQNLGVVPAPSRVTKKGRVIRDVSVGRALGHAIAQKGVKGTFDIQKVGDKIQHVVDEKFQEALNEDCGGTRV